MPIFTECVPCGLSIIITIIFSVVYFYFKYSFNYWKNLEISYLGPKFPYGNCSETIKGNVPFGVDLAKFYKNFKSKGHKYGGMYFFSKPSLLVVCPEFIKSILIKDFANFFDRGFYHDEENDPLSAHLFSLTGQKWRNLRAKLTPTFTSGKLKQMFQTVVNCSFELRDCLNEPIRRSEPFDIKHILVLYTTDVIGSCTFGIECNSFKNPNAEFITTSEKIFYPTLLDRAKFFLAFTLPKVAKYFKLRLTNKDVDIFYRNLIKETVAYRERNNVTRNDFMHLLIQLKNKGYIQNDDNDDEATATTLTLEELLAQAFLFFTAGFETSSTAMTWCLFELAQNQQIQDNLREEVIRVLKQHEGEITYDALMKMRYMDRVINESLRKYPPFMLIRRIVTKDYTLPETNKILPRGTLVFISVFALHNDPEFYPDPEKFDPERFTDENKASRPDYVFLPFGEGPRGCIGSRFAMMQMKIGICQLLINYKFTLDSKTELPIEFDPFSVVCSPKGKIWLSAKKIIN